MIGRRFHLTCTIQVVRKLLVRNGWPWQVPADARGAGRRGGGRVVGWLIETGLTIRHTWATARHNECIPSDELDIIGWTLCWASGKTRETRARFSCTEPSDAIK
ncbi:hypothetical protein [Streptomyces sp. NPDC047999]|uniref:hypothetical protein n=1 Tax=Streptomyces sp. NPDC047999 TaxID=3365497 RepID=UPI00371E320E